MVRPSRAAAVKDGRLLRPPEGLVLDGCEHGGRLVCVGNDVDCLVPTFVLDRREIADRGVAAARVVERHDTRPTVLQPAMRLPLSIPGIPGLAELFAFMR
jgi:hypothetical protein